MLEKDFFRIENLVNQMLEKGLHDDNKAFEKTGVKSENFYTFHLKVLKQLLVIERKKINEK